MYKNILVAVDGSAPSDAALREAVSLAQGQGATLRLVHVAQVLPPPGLVAPSMAAAWDVDMYSDAVERTGREVLDAAARHARAANVAAETILLRDLGRDAGRTILSAAKRTGADLIAMGTHGRSGLERILMGSVAESVARDTTVPLLLVKARREGRRRSQAAVGKRRSPAPTRAVRGASRSRRS